MTVRRLLPALALATSYLALNPGGATAQSYRTVAVARQIQDEQHFNVDVRFAAGRFQLRPDAGSALYRAQLVYDEDHFSPHTSYGSSSNTLRVGVTADGLRGKFKYDEDSRQQLNLAISPAVPTSLELELGAATADIELGGLALVESSIKIGAVESRIVFSRPNRITCSRFALAMGAAEVLVEHLGNARCEEIEVVGGVGKLTLDFTGTWDAASGTRVEIKLGLGSLTLRIPEQLGVEVDMDRLLASFDKTGFTQRGSHYFSHNYDSATTKLYLDVKAVLGEVSVVWVR